MKKKKQEAVKQKIKEDNSVYHLIENRKILGGIKHLFILSGNKKQCLEEKKRLESICDPNIYFQIVKGR